ncbi:MAG: 3-hydroxyacyl-CoA dehydrogenase family protein [Promethearchaeota archaeon]
MCEIKNIKTIVIIGAGVQGHAICQIALMAGFKNVVLNDINMDILNKAVDLMKNGMRLMDSKSGTKNNGLKALEERGQLSEGQTCESLLKKLTLETDLEKAVRNSDYIIEAVPEIMEIKQEVYKKLGTLTPNHSVLASNTSTMSISKIGEASGKPKNVIGMHFFSPIRSRLIEITKGEKTSNEAMDIGETVAYKLPCIGGKRMVARLEKETPGFIANRINIVGTLYLKWLLEQAVEKNIPYEEIDADVIHVMNPGPFVLMDSMGIDTVYGAIKYFEETVSKDFSPGKIFTDLIESGNLGVKTGKGFYDWSSGEGPKIDPSKKAGLASAEILLALQLNEGCRLIEQGIVNGYKIIDDVNLAGYGNPGPFIAGGKKNYERWSKLLEDFAEKSGYAYAKPCELMKTGAFMKMRK